MLSPIHRPSLLRRFTAVLGVVLVVLLNVLAASPELHAWVHGHEAHAEHVGTAGEPVGADDDSGCAITLFAHGVPGLLIFFLLVLARPLVRSIVLRAGDWLAAAQPRYWHVPSHAPPLV